MGALWRSLLRFISSSLPFQLASVSLAECLPECSCHKQLRHRIFQPTDSAWHEISNCWISNELPYPTPQYAENHQVPLPEAQYPANQYPAPNPEPHYPAGQYNNPGAVPQGDVYPTGYQPPKVEPTQTAEVPVYQKPSPEPHYQFPLDPYQAATYDPTYRNPQSIGYNPVHPQMPHIHPGQSPQGLQHPMSIPNSGVPLSPPYVRGTPPKMPEAVQQPEYAPPPAEAVAEHEGEEALPAGASYPSPKAQPLTLQYMRGLSDFLNNH